MMTRDGQVMGVTSAATVWVLAALGAMMGLDLLTQSVVMTLVILGLLTGTNWLESSVKALQHGVHHRRDASSKTALSHAKPQNDIVRRESDLSDNH